MYSLMMLALASCATMKSRVHKDEKTTLAILEMHLQSMRGDEAFIMHGEGVHEDLGGILLGPSGYVVLSSADQSPSSQTQYSEENKKDLARFAQTYPQLEDLDMQSFDASRYYIRRYKLQNSQWNFVDEIYLNDPSIADPENPSRKFWEFAMTFRASQR